MAPRFEDVPTELLVNITSHLTTPDYGSVRLTCSTVEKKVWDSFAKEFFTRKQFMLTRPSLQALIDISNHDSLKGYLKKVIIGTNLVPHLTKLPLAAFYARFLRDVDSDTVSWVREQFLDQLYLVNHGLDTRMLEEALSNLPTCQEIEIRDSYSPSRGRGTERWNSYGVTEFLKLSRQPQWTWFSEPRQKMSHFHGRPTEHPRPWSHHVFSAVTTAMARSKKNHYTSFMVTSRLRDNSFDEDAFYIPLSNNAKFAEAFLSIKTLMLPIHATPTAHSQTQLPRPGDFQSFLSLFPNLTWLRLNFDAMEHSHEDNETSEWLAEAKAALYSCPIQRVDLGKLYTEWGPFQDFICSFKALEELVLYKVRIACSSFQNTDSILLGCSY
jgi:hypothetical protein